MGHRGIRLAGIAALVLAALAGAAQASTVEECAEAATFIGNAARARDAGMSRDDFLARMEADFQVIRGFPREMRWFAANEDDERFLLDAAREVFDHPLAPEAHAARFARACVGRLYL